MRKKTTEKKEGREGWLGSFSGGRAGDRVRSW